MTTPEIIKDFPAYTIVKPVERHNFDLRVSRPTFRHGDEVIFEGRLFRIDPAPNHNAALTEITI